MKGVNIMKTVMTTKEISEETKKMFDATNKMGLNIKPKYDSLEEFDRDFFSGNALEI